LLPGSASIKGRSASTGLSTPSEIAPSARGHLRHVDFHLRPGEAAANVDRAAQSQRAGVLGFLSQRQIPLLLSQIDAAGAEQSGDFGIEYQCVGLHDAHSKLIRGGHDASKAMAIPFASARRQTKPVRGKRPAAQKNSQAFVSSRLCRSKRLCTPAYRLPSGLRST